MFYLYELIVLVDIEFVNFEVFFVRWLPIGRHRRLMLTFLKHPSRVSQLFSVQIIVLICRKNELVLSEGRFL